MKDSGVGKRSEVGVGEGEELDLFVISITISRQDYNLKEVGQHYNLKEDRLDFYLNITISMTMTNYDNYDNYVEETQQQSILSPVNQSQTQETFIFPPT